jgi:hypothetical protein
LFARITLLKCTLPGNPGDRARMVLFVNAVALDRAIMVPTRGNHEEISDRN